MVKYITRINFACFSLLLNMATRKIKITCVPHIVLLLNSAALGNHMTYI
jgi:hypothetical protein